MVSTKSAPIPDAKATAQAQGEQNRLAVADSSRLNAVDTYGPWGQTTYQFGDRGDLKNVPIAQTTTLTPTGQQVFNNQQQVAVDLSGRAVTALQNAPQTPFTLDGIKHDPNSYDTSQLSIWGGGNNLPYDPRSTNARAYSQQGADTAFNESMRMLQPQFDLQNRRMDSNLTNRGIPVGSKAWGQAQGDMMRAQNNAITGAANQAYMTGHQIGGDWLNREQGLRATAYGEDLTNHKQGYSDWSNKLQIEQGLRSSAINERERERLWGINDASLYLQGSPAMQMPNAPNVPTYQIQAPDLMGATYNSYNAAAQQAQAKNASLGNALGSAAQTGAMLWMMSSKVLKEDIGDAGSFLSRVRNLKLRSWRYTPEAAAAGGGDTELHIGPLAEDWARQFGGPETRIHLGDAIFVLYAAVQELAEKLDRVMEVLPDVRLVQDAGVVGERRPLT